MSALKLDDLRKAAGEKYPDFEIEAEDGKILGFKPLFRLTKAGRKAVKDALDLRSRVESLPEDHDVDQVELMTSVIMDAFKLTERSRGDFAALKKWAGTEDLAMWVFLFEQYQEVTELGEASPSES